MSKDRYEHLVGRECVLQVEGGGKEARGVVSDVGKDGLLFVHEDSAQGVPFITYDKIDRLVLAESAEREKPEPSQRGIGARTRQEGDKDTEHAAPDEPPRSLPGLQQRERPRQPGSPATSPMTSPPSGPPERQPREGEIPAVPPNASPYTRTAASPTSGPPERQPLPHPGETPAVPPKPEKDIDPRQQRGRG